jgi:hypothetical protein
LGLYGRVFILLNTRSFNFAFRAHLLPQQGRMSVLTTNQTHGHLLALLRPLIFPITPMAASVPKLVVSSHCKPACNERSCAMSLRLCSRKIDMSWSITDGDILWSTKSWCSPSGIQVCLLERLVAGLSSTIEHQPRVVG